MYGPSTLPQIVNATVQFGDTVDDPKAQLITSWIAVGANLTHGVLALMFYDGLDPGDNFAMFDGIPTTLDLAYEQSFVDMVATADSNVDTSPRGTFSVLPTTKITTGFLNAILNQSEVRMVYPPCTHQFPGT